MTIFFSIPFSFKSSAIRSTNTTRSHLISVKNWMLTFYGFRFQLYNPRYIWYHFKQLYKSMLVKDVYWRQFTHQMLKRLKCLLPTNNLVLQFNQNSTCTAHNKLNVKVLVVYIVNFLCLHNNKNVYSKIKK